jgi:chorismate synthase
MGVVLEDVKPGIEFPYHLIDEALQRRRPAQLDSTSARAEPDSYEVISGVFEDKTTGMPICILFRNLDHRSEDYEAFRDIFRPGHADYGLFQKFKIYDYRGGGRASGRETISRVVAGAVIKARLGNIAILSYPIKIGKIRANIIDREVAESNPYRWGDSQSYQEMIDYLSMIKSDKDSIGAEVVVYIDNIPSGLGDPVFEKLDACLSKAILSIPGVKGITFGDGFSLVEMLGSETNDDMQSNHLGGIVGGISNGKSIKLNVALRAPSSIGKPQKATRHDMTPAKIEILGRHDICLVPRVLPVIESMIQLVLADALAYQDTISGVDMDLDGYREAIDKIDRDILIALYRRSEVSLQIGRYKKKHGIPVSDTDREKDLIDGIKKEAVDLGISEDFVTGIWKAIITESKKNQQ